jgi:hypothetical protein
MYVESEFVANICVFSAVYRILVPKAGRQAETASVMVAFSLPDICSPLQRFLRSHSTQRGEHNGDIISGARANRLCQ